MSNQQVGAVALIALASWALSKLGYSLIAAPRESKLTLYVHEIRAPPDATLLAAAGTGQDDLTRIGFGSFLVFDNEIRESPEANSVLLGRQRGFGPISDLEGKRGIQLISTVVFGRGSSYNGTLTFQGNMGGPEPTSELAVIAGTGDFRGAEFHGLSIAWGRSLVGSPSIGPLVTALLFANRRRNAAGGEVAAGSAQAIALCTMVPVLSSLIGCLKCGPASQDCGNGPR